jgi:hypothetical protein
VPPARAHRRICVDIGKLDPVRNAAENARKLLSHPLAQMAARAGIEQKARRISAQWVAVLSRRTDWAIDLTVCSGTSPTAVT